MSDEGDVGLIVNGERHEGWENVSVHAGLQELAQNFHLGFVEKWSSSGTSLPIQAGDKVEIKIGETHVLTGYVDEFSEDYDSQSHKTTVSGRSKTGDLVDCSAVYKTSSITGKNFKQICDLLCTPLGVNVEVQTDIGEVIPRFKIQEGQTVFEALNDTARKLGILLLTDELGHLVLARASTELLPVTISTADNVKHGSVRISFRDRFSDYLFKGQHAGSDTHHGKAAAQIKNIVQDVDVPRFRPLTIIEHQVTVAALETRATYERNNRAGRGEVYTYDVRGWSGSHGLWKPNQYVHVLDEVLGVEGDLLITSVDLKRSNDEGKVATLELMARETFDVLKPPKTKHGKKGGKNPYKAIDEVLRSLHRVRPQK